MTYTYTGDGQLYSIHDSGTGYTYQYSYDSLGRLIASSQRDSGGVLLQTRQSYNTNNQLAGQSWLLTNADKSVTTYSESYSYNSADGSLATFTPAVGSQLSFTYDELRRLDTVTGGRYTKSYDYRDLSEANRTTAQVSSLSYSGFTNAPSYGYVYDALGYITSYTENGTTYGYTYDEQGQLVAASGYDQSYTYEYDSAGNITKRTQGTTEHSYSYDNTVWLDLLTKYDGQYIAYEGQTVSGSTVTGTPTTGNPISYYNGARYTFSWAEGRNLVRAVTGGKTYSYTYDSNGIRTGKTVDGVEHSYTYASSKLLRETFGSNVLDFFYDNAGYPYAVKYNGTLYYYITNLQGDVLHLVNTSGTTVVSYEYDPYGKPLTATGTMATINPLRYRGYYYDTETGFYYLQSRYYDPTICRFINADSYASTGQGLLGNNMCAYCLNCPSSAFDSLGERTYFINGISNDGENAPGYAEDFKAEMEKQGVDKVVPIPVYTMQNTFFKTLVGGFQVILEMLNINVYTQTVVDAIMEDLEVNPLAEGEQLNIVGYSGGGQLALNSMEVLSRNGITIDNVILIGTPVMELGYTSTKISMIYAMWDPLSWNVSIGVDSGFGGWYGHGGYFTQSNIADTVELVNKMYGGR